MRITCSLHPHCGPWRSRAEHTRAGGCHFLDKALPAQHRPAKAPHRQALRRGVGGVLRRLECAAKVARDGHRRQLRQLSARGGGVEEVVDHTRAKNLCGGTAAGRERREKRERRESMRKQGWMTAQGRMRTRDKADARRTDGHLPPHHTQGIQPTSRRRARLLYGSQSPPTSTSNTNSEDPPAA
jgi:hypothetical protein